MIRRVAIAAAMMLLALGSPARADVSPLPRTNPPSGEGSAEEDWRRARILVDAGVGIAVLPDEFKRYWNPDLGVGFGVSSPITPIVDLLLRAEFYDLGFDAAAMRDDRGLDPSTVIDGGGSASLFAALVGIRLHPSAEGLRPYLELGVGLPSVSVPSVTYDDPVVGFGSVDGAEIFGFDPCYSAGAGYEWFRPRTWGAFLDVRVVDAPGRTEPAHAWVSIRSGVSLRYPRLFR